MNITRKIEIVEIALDSLTQHHDADGAVRAAALNRIKEQCDLGVAAITAEIDAKIGEALGE
jgi:hypothetical protein